MNGALEQGEIEQIQTDLQENLMPNTATIFKKVLASNGQGGRTTKLVVRQADVPCGFGPATLHGDAEEVVADHPSAENRWLFRMPAETTVHPTDVVAVDGDPLSYEVEQLRSPRGTWSFLTRFQARAIDVGGPAESE